MTDRDSLSLRSPPRPQALALSLSGPHATAPLSDPFPASMACPGWFTAGMAFLGGTPCEQFIRAHGGWFTSSLTLLEAKAVLHKVYGVDPALATHKLTRFAAGALAVLEVDHAVAVAAWALSDAHNLDLHDGVLLQLARQHGAAHLATDDQQLAAVCAQYGISVQSPLDTILRQQIAAWESSNLAPKGLPRVLRRVFTWLNQAHPQAATDFWSQTGAGSHLP